MQEEVSYARKYRPTTLSNYVGNEGIKDTLQRYLRNKKPQTILLTGNTGCGKTTLARLIIKEYFCEDRDEELGACDKCSQCEAINEYIRTGSTDMLPDIQEIDVTAASGKKDIESFIETMEYPAIGSLWKVYLMDECHVLSASAQARILKILEEPPENVLIIFSTTNPEKLLDTIRNRCQLQLKVTKPNLKDVVSYLKRICLCESKDYDVEGLRLIATRSDFVLRDAANNLERVINTRGNAKVDSVSTEFNEVSDKIIFDFYKYYKEKDYFGYISVLYQIKTNFDFNQFLMSLTSFTIRGIYIMNGIDLEGLSNEELKSYKELFKQFSPQDLSLILGALKRMNVGSIEANLLAFIYHDEEVKDSSNEEVSFSARETSGRGLSDESAFRNRVMQIREEAKIKKGVESLEDKTQQVSLKDMGSLFQLEKVRK